MVVKIFRGSKRFPTAVKFFTNRLLYLSPILLFSGLTNHLTALSVVPNGFPSPLIYTYFFPILLSRSQPSSGVAVRSISQPRERRTQRQSGSLFRHTLMIGRFPCIFLYRSFIFMAGSNQTSGGHVHGFVCQKQQQKERKKKNPQHQTEKSSNLNSPIDVEIGVALLGGGSEYRMRLFF